LAVPVVTKKITCVDEFLRPFLDMPARLATFAVNRPGAINAALFAATIISERGTEVRKRLHERRVAQVKRVEDMKINDPLAGGTS
jgi:5-(carboxyamino)imidazole ribonucleotide mutase